MRYILQGLELRTFRYSTSTSEGLPLYCHTLGDFPSQSSIILAWCHDNANICIMHMMLELRFPQRVCMHGISRA